MPVAKGFFWRFCRAKIAITNRDSTTCSAAAATALLVTFRDHFLRPQNIATPDETALYPHHNPPVIFRKLRRFKADHPMHRQVDKFFQFNLGDFHPVQ